MTLRRKFKSIWVDAGLILGLILAVGTVYSVESRMPRPAANTISADHAKMVETHETPSPGSEANKAKEDLAGNVATQQAPLPRPEASKDKEQLAGNVATQQTPLPPQEASKVEDGSKPKVEIARNLTGLGCDPFPKILRQIQAPTSIERGKTSRNGSISTVAPRR